MYCMANPTLTTTRSAGAVLDVFCRNIGVTSASVAKVVGKSRSAIDKWRNNRVGSIDQVAAHEIASHLNEVCPASPGQAPFTADLFLGDGREAVLWLLENRPGIFTGNCLFCRPDLGVETGCIAHTNVLIAS